MWLCMADTLNALTLLVLVLSSTCYESGAGEGRRRPRTSTVLLQAVGCGETTRPREGAATDGGYSVDHICPNIYPPLSATSPLSARTPRCCCCCRPVPALPINDIQPASALQPALHPSVSPTTSVSPTASTTSLYPPLPPSPPLPRHHCHRPPHSTPPVITFSRQTTQTCRQMSYTHDRASCGQQSESSRVKRQRPPLLLSSCYQRSSSSLSPQPTVKPWHCTLTIHASRSVPLCSLMSRTSNTR